MKFKGIVDIVSYNKETNEETQRMTVNNVVTDTLLRHMSIPPFLTLSSETPVVDQGFTSGVTTYIYRVTVTPMMQPKTLTNDAYLEFYNRFAPPTLGTNSINSVLLGGYLRTTGGTNVFFPSAYVVLPSTFVQTVDDYVDVRYRLILQSDPNQSQVHQERIFRGLTTGSYRPSGSIVESSSYGATFHCTYANMENHYSFAEYEGLNTTGVYSYQGLLPQSFEVQRQPLLFKVGNKYTFDSDSASTGSGHYGDVITSVLYGRNISGSPYDFCIGASPTSLLVSNKAQSIQKHAGTALYPFFDLNHLASGSGKPIPNRTTNVNGPNKWFRLDITTGGDAGTAAYKTSVYNIIGFRYNTYQNERYGVPFVPYTAYSTSSPTNPQYTYTTRTVPGHHDLQKQIDTGYAGILHNYKIQRYNETSILTYDLSGVTILDVFTGNYKNFDTLSASPLTSTNIGQVETDISGNVWVACRDSGLYKIDVSTNIVTHITPDINGTPTTKCFGVDIGRAGAVWAVFDGALGQSTDGGSSWILFNETTPTAFIFSGISNGNWDKVSVLRADPTHSDDRLLLVKVSSYTGISEFAWWSKGVGGNGITGPSYSGSGQYRDRPQCWNVSDINGLWAGRYGSSIYKFTYGSASVTSLGSCSLNGVEFAKTSTGNDAVFLNSGTTSHFAATSISLNDGNGTIESTTPYVISHTGSGFQRIVHLGSGIFFFDVYSTSGSYSRSSYIQQCTLTDLSTNLGGNLKHVSMTSYGWDGVNWTKDHPGSKVVHTGIESLVDDVDISFVNGPIGTTSFFAGDFYNFVVCDGIFKDNISTYSFTIPFYTKPVEYDKTDFDGGVVSAMSLPTGPVSWLTGGTVLGSGALQFCQLSPNANATNGITDTATSGGFTAVMASGFSKEPMFGDFSVQFELIDSVSGNVHFGVGTYTKFETPVVKYGFRLSGSTLYYIKDGVSIGTSTQSFSSVDVLTVSRVGNTITWAKNGTSLFTSATSSPSSVLYVMQCVAVFSSSVLLNGVKASIIANGNAYGTKIGTSVSSTGVYDTRFIACDPGCFGELQISVNGTPLVVNDENTLLSNANAIFTIDGKVIVDSSHNGNVVTGKYMYIRNS